MDSLLQWTCIIKGAISLADAQQQVLSGKLADGVHALCLYVRARLCVLIPMRKDSQFLITAKASLKVSDWFSFRVIKHGLDCDKWVRDAGLLKSHFTESALGKNFFFFFCTTSLYHCFSAPAPFCVSVYDLLTAAVSLVPHNWLQS